MLLNEPCRPCPQNLVGSDKTDKAPLAHMKLQKRGAGEKNEQTDT